MRAPTWKHKLCAHGIGLAIISIPYYKYIYNKYGLDKFVRFAEKIWEVQSKRSN